MRQDKMAEMDWKIQKKKEGFILEIYSKIFIILLEHSAIKCGVCGLKRVVAPGKKAVDDSAAKRLK